jgi:hypothetical protein
MLKVVDQVSGWEYGKGRRWPCKVGGDLPGRSERADAGLSVTPSGRQMLSPLVVHYVLHVELKRAGRRQAAEFDAGSHRQSEVT